MSDLPPPSAPPPGPPSMPSQPPQPSWPAGPNSGSGWAGAPASGGWSQPGQVPPRAAGIYYSPGPVILMTIVTLGIWTLVWSYRTGDDLKRYNGDGLGGGLMLLIDILAWPAVMFLIPNEIQNMYQRDGRQSPVSALLGLWFLLPLIGNLIWYLKVQRALNEFWVSKGAQPV